MSSDTTLRDPHLSGLCHQIDPIKHHAQQVAGNLTPRQLEWRPARRVWSVGDCLEHVIVSANLYYERMDALLETAGKSDVQSPWHPSFMGRMLIKSVTTSRRLKRPKKFKPPPKPRPDVLDAFLRVQDRLAELMREADGVDLSRARVSSPVSRVVRVNLGDCFAILVHHSKRHLRQASRVADALASAGSTAEDSKGSPA